MLVFTFIDRKTHNGSHFNFAQVLVNFWSNVNQPQGGGLNLTRNDPKFALVKINQSFIQSLDQTLT